VSLQPIAEKLALQDLMLKYASSVDERDRGGYTSCFANDVTVVNFTDSPIHGREAWVDHVWALLAGFSSTQHLLSPVLATVSGDQAETRTDVQATHILADAEGAEGAEQLKPFVLWASYHTKMHRQDGEWKIVRHELAVRGTRTD